MVKYIADSSCDIRHMEGVAFESVPLVIYTDNEEFIDNEELNIAEMLEKLEKHKGRSYSSCPSSASWLEAFEGGDELYVFTITSGLSGAYNSAMVAKEMFLQEHPEAKIEVFDTLSTGPEMVLALEKTVELKKQGMNFEQICGEVHKYLEQAHLFFVLNSIHNLAQNGRVNKVVASAVGVLGISIIGIASEEGQIKQIGKCRGEKRVVSSLIEKMQGLGYHGGKLRICHVFNEAICNKIAHAVHAIYPEADIQFYPAGALCSFYAEKSGIILGFEC